MLRDLGGAALRPWRLLQSLGVRGVEPATFSGEQIRVDRFAHQRVAEAVVALRGHDDVREYRLAGGAVELGRVAVVDGGEKLVRDAHPACRQEPQQVLRRSKTRS